MLTAEVVGGLGKAMESLLLNNLAWEEGMEMSKNSPPSQCVPLRCSVFDRASMYAV